jgi:release factor glutamine methyltransferase
VPTVAALLAASGLPAREARALLAQATGLARETLIAHPERAVEAETALRFARAAGRRRAGEPLAYLLGEREFYGRRFGVDASVLVPRPETELLVQLALERARTMAAPRVLELGTGSGCIAVSIALELPSARVVATDVSDAALAVARANAQHLGARVAFVESDWFAMVEGRFDLIVGNPPYVAAGDPHLEELRHEPVGALTAGPDGLASLRQIVACAPAHLTEGGWLLLEHGYDQAEAVRSLLASAGFGEIETRRDLAGVERVTLGTYPPKSGERSEAEASR